MRRALLALFALLAVLVVLVVLALLALIVVGGGSRAARACDNVARPIVIALYDLGGTRGSRTLADAAYETAALPSELWSRRYVRMAWQLAHTTSHLASSSSSVPWLTRPIIRVTLPRFSPRT